MSGSRDMDKEEVLRNLRQVVRILQGSSELLEALPFDSAETTGMRTVLERRGLKFRGRPVRVAALEVGERERVSALAKKQFG